MPKKPPAPPQPDDEVEELIPISEGAINIMEMLDEVGEKADAVLLTMWDPDEKKKVYVATIPVAAFSLDYVREQFGGGSYQAAVTDKRGRMLKAQGFTIAKHWRGRWHGDAPSTPGELAATPKAVDPQAAILMGQLAGMDMVLKSQAKMLEALTGTLGTRQPGADKESGLDVGLKIAGFIREAMMGAGGNGGAFSAKELGEMFREGLETGRMASGGGEGGDNVLLAPIANAAGKLLDHALTKEKGGAVPAAALPAPPAQAPKPEAPAVQLNLDKAPWLIHLRPFMPEIATWAQRGWDPTAYIPSMCARIPEALLDEIELASRSPSFIDDALSALPPQFMAYKAWLTRALEALRDEVKSDEEGGSITGDDDDDSGGAG